MNGIKNRIIMVVTAILFSSIAAGSSACNAEIINKVIDVQTAYDMIQSNQNDPNFVIIDVRTQEEFNAGHIAGAILIDFYLPDFKDKISELDHSKKSLVYCRTARRSAEVLKIIKELGFSEAYDLAGGITQWKANGFPVVTN